MSESPLMIKSKAFVYRHGIAPRKIAVKCNSHHRCPLCKICVHLNRPHAALHLNWTHITVTKRRICGVFAVKVPCRAGFWDFICFLKKEFFS